jgi:hypothetical protein
MVSGRYRICADGKNPVTIGANMRGSTALIVVLLLASLFGGWPAQAADAKDVAKVIAFMNDPKTKVIDRKTYEGGGVQIVFVTQGKRYTFYHTGSDQPSLKWLSVWVRPNGTNSLEQCVTFSDHLFDGTVDSGAYMHNGTDAEIKRYNQENQVGEEHRTYWQSLYDQAIADALKALSP